MQPTPAPQVRDADRADVGVPDPAPGWCATHPGPSVFAGPLPPRCPYGSIAARGPPPPAGGGGPLALAAAVIRRPGLAPGPAARQHRIPGSTAGRGPLPDDV
ncbi:hypothetical protein GCM10010472_67980 [Pseudonocardia halophobica]|uniref:Uncharacterized protein n=1 Tax=Pseudonocardia halophobica TaxID=29401 RepID=A0A9W6L410_9PSEU|nr:hypothetical protein GCM10017577_37740 [Pseudonocardia halophobica]